MKFFLSALRNLGLFVGLLFFSVASFADDCADLHPCRVQCSQSCRGLAAKYKSVVEDALGCGAPSDVVSRCNWHFSGKDAAECAGKATSAEAVDRCAWALSGDRAALCASHAKSGPAIDGLTNPYFMTARKG